MVSDVRACWAGIAATFRAGTGTTISAATASTPIARKDAPQRNIIVSSPFSNRSADGLTTLAIKGIVPQSPRKNLNGIRQSGNRPTRKAQTHAFTLIELLVVIAHPLYPKRYNAPVARAKFS